MIGILKNWALPLAMLLGALAHTWLSGLSFLTPYLLFGMLLLAFCKVSFRALRWRRWHAWLLLIQLFGAALVYAVLQGGYPLLAQGIAICLLCPTATAASVITAKLGGEMEGVISYTLLSSVMFAVVAALFFPYIGGQMSVGFFSTFGTLLGKVSLVLLLPILLAWLLKTIFSSAHSWLLERSGYAFHLWVVALVLVTARTVHALVQDTTHVSVKIGLAVGALLACLGQFLLGKRLGRACGEEVSVGQSLGQKNTILAIWVSYSFLHPLAAVAPGSYVLWQNFINAWQLWKKRTAHSPSSTRP